MIRKGAGLGQATPIFEARRKKTAANGAVVR